jgi:hypothetical protein
MISVFVDVTQCESVCVSVCVYVCKIRMVGAHCCVLVGKEEWSVSVEALSREIDFGR